jgi:hypothetical protein
MLVSLNGAAEGFSKMTRNRCHVSGSERWKPEKKKKLFNFVSEISKPAKRGVSPGKLRHNNFQRTFLSPFPTTASRTLLI